LQENDPRSDISKVYIQILKCQRELHQHIFKLRHLEETEDGVCSIGANNQRQLTESLGPDPRLLGFPDEQKKPSLGLPFRETQAKISSEKPHRAGRGGALLSPGRAIVTLRGNSGIVERLENERVIIRVPDGTLKGIPMNSIASWHPFPIGTIIHKRCYLGWTGIVMTVIGTDSADVLW
jgi:hypothetical protein